MSRFFNLLSLVLFASTANSFLHTNVAITKSISANMDKHHFFFPRDVHLAAVAERKNFYDSERENEEKTTNRNSLFSWGKDKIPILSKREEKKALDSSNSFASSGSIQTSPTFPKKKKNIYHVETLTEYKDIVASEKNSIVVVRFYAEWCKACKAIKPYFFRMSKKYNAPEYLQDASNPRIKFVEVPLTHDNSMLHQGLGIPSLPFGHIYHPESGLVEERKIAKKNFKIFEDVLESYVNGSCECNFVENQEGEIEVVSLGP